MKVTKKKPVPKKIVKKVEVKVDHFNIEKVVNLVKSHTKYTLTDSTGKNKYDLCCLTDTSSCGTLQIRDGYQSKAVNYQSINPKVAFTKLQRQQLLEQIYLKDSSRNHLFFIDREDGILESFFDDLGFQQCWQYLNKNSENQVRIWSLNKWTDDEVENMLNNDEEDYD